MVKWLQQRRERQPVILAGNVQKSLRSAPSEIASGSQEPLQSDPWGAWLKNHGSSGLAQSNNGHKPRGMPSTVQTVRKLEAPIEDKFSRQEEQMQQIRDVTDREIKTLYDHMHRLEKSIDEQKHALDVNAESTAAEFRALKVETNQQLKSMADVFKDSLSAAIKSHDGVMNAQFNEIKAMIAAGTSVKSPPPKKPRQAGAEDDACL